MQRIDRLRGALTPQEWRRVAGMAAVVAGLHAVGFVILLVVAPQQLGPGESGAFTVGIGLTAYTLGLRHAFDADHIAAIDNTTRKLMSEGKRPLSVGFFFSLGHSTVVFVLAFLLAGGVHALAGQVKDDGSALQVTTDWIGTLVSASFLYLIAVLNLVVLVGVVRMFRRMRRGECDDRELEQRLTGGGMMTRLLGRWARAIDEPWKMYPLGVLFGLGFDTATEVALLFLATGAAFSGLPFYAILCLPILFAAGMSLLDTIDGAFMNFAYGWALSRPVRRVFYSIVITGLSVAVAFLIATVELMAILAEKLGLSGGVWEIAGAVELDAIGYLVVALFVATWAIAVAVWRLGRIEERWSLETPRA